MLKIWAKYICWIEAFIRFFGGIPFLMIGAVIDRFYEQNSTAGTGDYMAGIWWILIGVVLLIDGIAAFACLYFLYKFIDEKDPRFPILAVVGFFVGSPIGYLCFFFGMKKDFVLVSKLEAEMAPPETPDNGDDDEEPILL